MNVSGNYLVMIFLCLLDRQHVISFLGWSISNNAGAQTVPAIVLEFAKYGSLRSTVKNTDIIVSDAQKVKWSQQIADAIAYIHEQGFIHRDIKPDNVLVDANFDIKMVKLARIRWHQHRILHAHSCSHYLRRLILDCAAKRESINLFLQARKRKTN